MTDGNPGLISAFEQVFSESLRQRCAIHAARNVLKKVSKPDQEEAKRDYLAILDGIETPPASRQWRSPSSAPRPSPRSGAPATEGGRLPAQ
jgi:transposase-like protein